MAKCKELIERYEIFEMANASKDETGLPVVSWFAARTGKERHGPRFRVRDGYQNSYSYTDLITVILDKNNPKFNVPPKIITKRDQKDILAWAVKNYETLIQLWDGKISHGQFLKFIAK
jgi:hypothetical protein